MKSTICLDFNGVLDDYKGYADGEEYPPFPGARDFLEKLNQKYDIVVQTVIEVEKVRKWLIKYGLDHLVIEVTNIKPPAIAYVDDRAICFRGNYEEVLQRLDGFRPHWSRFYESK